MPPPSSKCPFKYYSKYSNEFIFILKKSAIEFPDFLDLLKKLVSGPGFDYRAVSHIEVGWSDPSAFGAPLSKPVIKAWSGLLQAQFGS
jgi:hypothetical protein